MNYKLTLKKKFLLIVISSVASAITDRTLLIVRREPTPGKEEKGKNAQIVTRAISRVCMAERLAEDILKPRKGTPRNG